MPSSKKPIAVRLDDETRSAVKRLAAKFHVSEATIGIWAFNALLEYVRINDGRVVLPLNFEEILKNKTSDEEPTKIAGEIKKTRRTFQNITPGYTPPKAEDSDEEHRKNQDAQE